PGHDLAGVHTRSHLESNSPVPLELVVQSIEARAHFGRSADGAQGVVLVERRNSEDRHYRVADELLDRAAVSLVYGAGFIEVPRHHSPHRLWVACVSEARRAGHVREDHCDCLAHLACSVLLTAE